MKPALRIVLSSLQNTEVCTVLRKDVQSFLCLASVDEHNVLFIWNMKSQAWCEHFFHILKTAHFFQSKCIRPKPIQIVTISPALKASSYSSALSLHKQSGKCVTRLPNPLRISLTTVSLAWNISFLALGTIG